MDYSSDQYFNFIKNGQRLVISIVLASFVAGILISGFFFQLKIKQLSGQCAANEAKITADNKMYVPNQMMGISGKVMKIGNNVLTVRVVFPGGEKDYSVKVASDAKLTRKELTQESIANPAVETPISFSDIKENDAVIAIASENIKDKTNFETKALTIMILPSVPSTSSPIPSAF